MPAPQQQEQNPPGFFPLCAAAPTALRHQPRLARFGPFLPRSQPDPFPKPLERTRPRVLRKCFIVPLPGRWRHGRNPGDLRLQLLPQHPREKLRARRGAGHRGGSRGGRGGGSLSWCSSAAAWLKCASIRPGRGEGTRIGTRAAKGRARSLPRTRHGGSEPLPS